MQLKIIYKQSRKVAIPITAGEGSLLDELGSTQPDMAGSAKGMCVLFRRYAENGRHGLTTALFHEVDANAGIWEFIKGRLRVLCFIAPDDGSLLILSHYFVKKTQKTPTTEINKAIRVIEDYERARKSGALQLEQAP